MNRKLRKEICDFISNLHLKSGDRLPSIEQIRRKTGATHYSIYQELKEISRERKYEIVHGSGIYLPGRKKEWKPYEYSVALISPGSLLEQDLIYSLHTRFMKHHLNLLPLGIPHFEPGYEEETLRYLLSRRIWGLIIEPHPESRENLKLINRMQTQGCRCILLSRDPEVRKRYHYFSLDYTGMGRHAVDLAKKWGYRRIIFLNHTHFNWHMQRLEHGLLSRSKELDLELIPVHNFLFQDRFEEKWEWEERKIFPLLPETLYVVENIDNRASHLYNVLRRNNKFKSSMVLSFCRRKSDIDRRFPCFYFNDDVRFEQIADKLLHTGVWTKTGTEKSFYPDLLLPDNFSV